MFRQNPVITPPRTCGIGLGLGAIEKLSSIKKIQLKFLGREVSVCLMPVIEDSHQSFYFDN